MPLGDICPDLRNSRRYEITPENDPKLLELADSIKQFGNVIEPIVVRLRSEEDIEGGYCPECRYMLISGHRRLAAAKLAGLSTIHCSVWENLTDKEAFEMQLVENLHRLDLLPSEEATAYKRMKEELGYPLAEIALRVGKSEKHVGRYLKLLTLPDGLVLKIDQGDLSIAKALHLCSLPEVVLKDIIENRPSLLRADVNAIEMKERIISMYMNVLSSDILFDKKIKYTSSDGTVWPACSKCPHKNQKLLFDEFEQPNACPYSPCFTAKQQLAMAAQESDDEEEEQEEAHEDSEDGESESYTHKPAKWETEQKIRQAVADAKAGWYLDKLMEKGIAAVDVFPLDSDFLDNNLFIQQHIGKEISELKQSGTYEEILKAKVISELVNEADYNEDEVVEWLHCEQCPEEVLQAARHKAMGVDKK